VIATLLARLTPKAWLHTPRPTARLRLTLLYGALFLLSGAVLLAVSYVLAARATSITVPGNKPSAAPRASSRPAGAGRLTSGGGSYVVRLPPAQGARLQAQAADQHDRAMHELLIGSLLTLAGMTVLSLALGWLVAGRVLRPVRMISAAAREISANSLHERVRLDGPDDEFRELAATLDNLLERLQASFDSQRRFVANASHELRTPLTLDHALLERALRKAEPTHAFWRDTCERLLASSRQQDRLIEAMLTLARSEGPLDRAEPLELGDVIESVLLSPELETTNAGLNIQTQINAAPVNGDQRLLERLVRNVVDNACRHNIAGGDVEITTDLRHGRAVLVVTNTGPVVPDGDSERLLQPFQRASADRTKHGEGLGLGLSIVQAIATIHHANLTLTPRPHGGLRIEVSFPAPTVHDKLATVARSGTSWSLSARSACFPGTSNSGSDGTRTRDLRRDRPY
jgi:signal transduction histidine kinase